MRPARKRPSCPYSIRNLGAQTRKGLANGLANLDLPELSGTSCGSEPTAAAHVHLHKVCNGCFPALGLPQACRHEIDKK